MNSLTLISLVRHGHVYNPRDVHYGRLPRFGLDEEGISQAKAASQVLRTQRLAAIFSSPLLRARQTALIIQAAHSHLALHISETLTEVYSPFDGRPASGLRERNWDLYTGIPPEYEQPIDVFERAQKFIQKARRAYFGQHIVAATHGDLIAFSFLWAKSAPIEVEQKQKLQQLGIADNYPAPGSITTFTFATAAIDELPRVEYINPSLLES